jgi:hypothetical protein
MRACCLADAVVNGRLHSQIDQVQQQLQHARPDSVDSLVRALPSHISDFGDSVGLSLAEDEGALLAAAAAVLASAPTAQAGRQSDAAAAGPAARASQHAAAGGAEEGGAPHLPSHISAFGDDLGPLSEGRAMLSGGGDLDDGFPAGGSVCTLHVCCGWSFSFRQPVISSTDMFTHCTTACRSAAKWLVSKTYQSPIGLSICVW